MVNFILGGAGCGKSTLMAEKISELAGTKKKVIVIVPEQFSFDSDKKLYRTLGAEKFNSILSLSFTSLAKDIFEKFGGRSGEYADDIKKYIIMNKSLRTLSKNKNLLFFGNAAEKAVFAEESLKLVTDLRQSGVAPDTVMERLASSDASLNGKLMDIALIYYTYDQMLKENGLKDSLSDISESAATANINDYFKNSAVFFDEFESFTYDEYDLIDTVIAQSDEVYISLRLENEEDNRYCAFDSVGNTRRRFLRIAEKYSVPTSAIILDKPLRYRSADLAHLNKNVLRNERKSFGKTENIKVIECRDIYEESDYICSEINRLVKREGYKFSDIAVISRRLGDYTYILEAALEKYDIPYCMNVKKSVMHTSIMQLISAVLDIISTNSPSSESIFKYAKTQLNNFRQEEIAALENYCYEWGIDGKKWFEPFTFDGEKSKEVEKLRLRIIEPIVRLKKRCNTVKSSEICLALYDFLEETGVPVKVWDMCRDFEEKNLIYLSKELKRLWGIFIDILDSIAEMMTDTDIENFREVFIMLMRQVTYSLPPQTLDGVDIMCAETSRPDSPRAVFVCGASDGFFPAAVKQGGILNDNERLRLEEVGISLSRSTDELIADEKLVVYKSLTYASDRLYISYPLSSPSGKAEYPADVISQIREMFTDDIMEYASEKGLVFYSSTMKAAYYNYVRGFSSGSSETESIKKILEKDEFYSSRIKYLETISREKTIDIKDKSLIRKLYTDRLSISATSFEEYNYCHFKFFCKRGLRLYTLRKREIDRLGKGNLVHICLEKVLSSCKTKEEFDSLTGERISEIIADCTELFCHEQLGGMPSEARDRQTLKKITKGIESLIKHLQEELSQSQFRPVDFEFKISGSEDGLTILKAENGVEIVLRGYIDRVDMFEKDDRKYIRIIDYKTGEKRLSLSDIYYGINMQMLIYMFCVTGKSGKYSGCEPAGVLYMPSESVSCARMRTDDSPIENTINEHYKMNGLVLNDKMVLSAMEKDIAGVYIPASVTAKGELNKRSSSVFTKKQFDGLRRYTDKLILDMCGELYDGNIDAYPLVGSGMDPCLSCDYWSVCGISESGKQRAMEKEAKELLLAECEKEAEDEEQVD